MLLNNRINQYLIVCGIKNETTTEHNDDVINNLDYSQSKLNDLTKSIKSLERQEKFADALQIAGAVVIATQLAKYSNYVYAGYESFTSFLDETSNNSDNIDNFFKNLSTFDLDSIDFTTITDLADGASIVADIVDGISTLGVGLLATRAAKKAGELANAELESKYNQLKVTNNDKNKIHTLLKNEKNMSKRKDKLKQFTKLHPNLLF